ncbi:hypothetical protein [Sediminicoccus rosea]|uniref:Uncharacterized protein n=1 Tax=Sediminicoccus rosea TaxID=1225128 RepID=A0ABZ0PKZ9_9PROT|nr:hypothetical protein [Sediminicoccus rosea]WPB86418.1 hypothetical protein R9Z33_05970 [Sediminicoccus rosea]
MAVPEKPAGKGNVARIASPEEAAHHRREGHLARITGGKTDRFNNHAIRQLVDTLWLPGWADRDQVIGAAVDAVAGFEPTDPVEGMMATLAVAQHAAAMECLRRAMLAEQPFEITTRLRHDAAKCTRAFAEMAEAIDRRRGKGQQTVRVEHVTVQAGGQAIVGAVAAPSGKARGVGHE